MRTHKLSLLLGVLLLLNACAALPTGPRVLILPGAGKPLEVFQRDDGECQAYASHQLPPGTQAGASAAATLQWRYDMAYTQCMYAKGHRVPGDTLPSPPGASLPPPASP
jgi:hypothetical protein